jgi:tartrate dehydrogenase/decarboxylase/D-malate dehydrogenase
LLPNSRDEARVEKGGLKDLSLTVETKMAEYRIAVIPGDGIGKEVVPEGMRVLEAVGKRYQIHFTWDVYPWSCETYMKTGRMVPEDGIEQL